MTKREVYNPTRGERHVDFLYGIRVVRRYIARKNDISEPDLEFLCDLHALKRFRRQDFDNGTVTLTWDKDRWKRMLDNDWVKVYRERKPSAGRNYKIYSLTYKGRRTVEYFYEILCGEKPIPEVKQHNSIMKEETYNDKRYAAAIRAFNAAKQKL